MVASPYHISRLLDTETWLNNLIAEAWAARDDVRVRQMKKLRLMVKDAVQSLSAKPARRSVVKEVRHADEETGRVDAVYLGRL